LQLDDAVAFRVHWPGGCVLRLGSNKTLLPTKRPAAIKFGYMQV
jgi:hypothetical protein